MDIVRKEAERCDRLASFFICMSLAGGTGSGVGSYYTEMLRESFQKTCIVNMCVWPFSTGEVILQNYNLLLTLNKLFDHSDACIVVENDALHQICKRLKLANPGVSSNNKASKEIAFDDLNALVAHKLASFLQPCSNEMNMKNYLNHIIADLCPHSDYKLLSLNNVPQLSEQSIEFSSFQWSGLYKHARQLISTGGFHEEGLNWTNAATNRPNKTLTMSLFARGDYADKIDEHSSLIDSYFGSNFRNNTLAPHSLCLSTPTPINLWHVSRPFKAYEKSLTLLSNSQSPALKLESLINKAWSMFSSKAYVHQYVKYGNFEEENLLHAFIFAEQLVKNYLKI
jgi:tubulin delta